jgi:hypothetical protein
MSDFLGPAKVTKAGLDADITAKINDSASAARGALNATYAPVTGSATYAAKTELTLTAVNGSSKVAARPTWPGIVAWSGTVEPLSSVERDLFVDTAPNDPDWFDTARFGFFSHYTYGSATFGQTIYPNGTRPGSVASLAADFNVAGFVADMQAFGVEYVTLTAWHYAMNTLYPSAVMDSYRPGHSATRDVIQELIDAFAGTGIKFVPYIHLTDGHDMSAGDQTATGWDDATNGYKAWNDFINALLVEFNLRYGKAVDGLWIDMVFESYFQDRIDKARLRHTLLKGNPSRVIIGNGRYDNVAPSIGGGSIDYASQEYYPYPASINDWVASDNQTVPIATNTATWWSSRISTGADATFTTAANMFRFLVLDLAVNRKGGGIAYNAGPYAGAAELWEPGVHAAMTSLYADHITPVVSSIKGTKASERFPKTNTATLTNIGTPGWVATTKLDDSKEYVHVLNAPPSGTSITLPTPAGGAFFPVAKRLSSGAAAGIAQGPSGVTLTLPGGDTWSTTDTVFELTSATMVFADTFTRADSATIGSTEVGALAWQFQGGAPGNALIESNALGYANITGGAQRFVVVDTGVNTNFAIDAVLKTRPANLRPTFNFLYGATGAYGYTVSGDGTGKWKVEKKVSGALTLLTTSTLSVTSGDHIHVDLTGTALNITVNGTSIYSATVDAAVIAGNGKGVGFGTYLDAMETRWDSIQMYRTV